MIHTLYTSWTFHTLPLTFFFLLLSCALALIPVSGRDCFNIHNCDDCARSIDCVWCEDFDTCQFSDTYSCRRPDFSVSSCPDNRLAVGAIVGVVVGGFFLVMCIIGIVFFCRRNRDGPYAQPVIMTSAYPTPATVVYTGSPVQQQPPMGQPIVYNAQGQPIMSPQYGQQQQQQQPNYGAPVYGAQPTYAQSPQPFAGQPHQMGQPPVYSQQQQPQPPPQQQQPFVGQPHQMGQQPYAQQPYAQQTQPGY